MDHTWVDVARVIVDERRKRDLGNLGPLTKSIEQHGLMNPIIVTMDNRLISGWRRLSVFKKLGRKNIEAYIVSNVFDAVERLKEEGASPVYSKEMVWSEMVIFGQVFEDLDEDRMYQRKINARLKGAELRYKGSYGAKWGDLEPNTVGLMSEVFNVSYNMYYTARKVYLLANDPEASDELLKLGQQAVKYMDETGQPNGGLNLYNKGREKALRRERPEIMGDVATQRKVFEGAKPVVSGLIQGFRGVTEIHPELKREEIDGWLTELVRLRRETEQLIKKLRRHLTDG